uniref:lysozyme inhibitor LprI family protein n=1 Tax=Sphingomonas bacterium TaxID=1895847 RepID=UPI002603818A|nr:lysozyme inhibitor LprI family protein [Sphingomonas bacterium]
MLRRILSITALAAASAAMPAHADTAYDKCVAKGVTNIDYSTCGAAMIDRLEASLNATWKSVYGGLPAEAKPALLAEQRLWLAYKEKSCAVYSTGVFGREGQVLGSFTCRAKVLTDRIADLEDLGSG